MSDLIDSAYNPTLIAGSNIFITGVDTPSGRQITISSTGSGGGTTTPAGSNSTIQYNNAGAFGADFNFTRDPSTTSTLIGHNTNDTKFELDNAAMGFIDGAAISRSYDSGNKNVGTTIGQNSISGEYSATLVALDLLTGQITRVTAEENVAELLWSDNAFALPTIENNINVNEFAIIATFDNSSKVAELKLDGSASTIKFTDITAAETTKITVDSNITFEFPGGEAYTFPNADGSTDQILATDGAGQLSWETPSIPSIIPAYDDDAVAGTAGLATGDIYQTTGAAVNPLNVAGMMMVKQ